MWWAKKRGPDLAEILTPDKCKFRILSNGITDWFRLEINIPGRGWTFVRNDSDPRTLKTYAECNIANILDRLNWAEAEGTFEVARPTTREEQK